MGKLAAMAEEIKKEAAEKGKARRSLSRGLVLTLWRDGLDWVLSLTRYGSRPSDMELAICRRAFDVPDEAEAEGEEINAYHVRRLRWLAASQGPLFDLPEPTVRMFGD